MENQDKNTLSAPPRLIPSFTAGFNSVAGHIRLIILPVLLDIVLWFAPRLSIKPLAQPMLQRYFELVAASGGKDLQAFITGSQQLIQDGLDQFNLLNALRTLPIGVPSLLSGRGILGNPLGPLEEIGLGSMGAALGLWLLIALVGIAAGSLFFGEIARISLNMKEKLSLGRVLKNFRDTMYLTVSSYVLLAILAIPAVILVFVISMISPTFSQLSIIFISLLLIWLLMPLIFSPHGVYGYNQNVFTSAINSIRLVRYFLPGTGIFILMGVLMSQGMDILWTFPTEDSWMVLVGILGHAFITTGVIASSFVYYRGGLRWMNERMQHLTSQTQMSLNKQ